MACTTAVASQPLLGQVQTDLVRMPGRPFGVATTSDGLSSFVALYGPKPGIELISDRTARPTLVRTVSLPAGSPGGVALTSDGRYLVAADGSGAVVLSTTRVDDGAPRAVLGTLSASAPGDSAGGAINVVLSPDDRFAFVSLEDAGVIAVFNLHAALADGFRRSAFVGQIRLGVAPIGMAISPDGRWLYATSEAVAGPLGGAPTDGTVSVVDLRSAERSPANAVLARATAGCSPTRVIVSADGNVVWVSARSSDELLAFSANRLRSDPSRALLSATRVGEAPVGTALVDQGRQIVVTDSNQFDTPGARSGLTVVDTAAALAGRPALLGVVKAGAFPRLLSIAQDGKTLLITNFASRQLESIQLDQLP